MLAGPAQLTTRGGAARVSVRLTEPWRAELLAPGLAERGLDPERDPQRDGSVVVRTAFATVLAALALAWTAGSVKRPPPGFRLDGPRLRWWCMSAGWTAPEGYQLALGRSDEAVWSPVGAALAAAGLPAALVRGRAAPVYRLAGARRAARLAELVGDRPAGAPAGAWPGDPPGTL